MNLTFYSRLANKQMIASLLAATIISAVFLPDTSAMEVKVKDNSQPVTRTFGDETQQQKDARMQWWRHARFGMFIHWRLYAIPAGQWNGETKYDEWIMVQAEIPVAEYEQFCSQFNPVKFDVHQWVKMVKDTGMKYLVITSKHHDGFCLWDSQVSDYDVVERTPFKRDILKELSEACKKQGIVFCLYYSIMDWHHSDYLPRRKFEKRSAEGAGLQKYIAYMKAQLKELITRYDPAVLWFDGEWEGTWTHEEGVKLHDYVCSLKPDIIINNRVDKSREDSRDVLNKEGHFAGDFGTPEQEIPAQGLPGVDWESCMTMNQHFGWNKHDKNFKSSEDLIRKLVDIASKGGNFLLNIGPKADGTFPAESVEHLAAIGKWMDVNGESIYGTTQSPFAELSWGRCTKKTGCEITILYLHVFDWPKDGKLVVKLTNDVQKVYLLANKHPLQTITCSDGVIIEVPKEPLDAVDTVIVLTVNGKL